MAEIQIGDFTVNLMKTLGHGEFGTTYCAYFDEEEFAAKLVKGKDNEDSSAEIKILGNGRFRHENIVALVEYYHIKENVWLIYELAKGHLHGFCMAKERSLDIQIHISKQLIDAVAYLHGGKDKVIHRCITPAYILYTDATPTVKLHGFFRAKIFRKAVEDDHITLDEYKAPECHAKEAWGLPTDIFAVAMVMLAMHQHTDRTKPLYPRSLNSLPAELLSMIGVEMQSDPEVQLIQLIEGLPKKENKYIVYRQLIKEMALYNETSRPTAEECLARIKMCMGGDRQHRKLSEASSATAD